MKMPEIFFAPVFSTWNEPAEKFEARMLSTPSMIRSTAEPTAPDA